MKKKNIKLIILIFIIILMMFSKCFAVTNLNQIELDSINLNEINTQEVENYLEQENINLDGVDTVRAIEIYEELIENYSNDEIADIIEENSDIIEESGINKEAIDAGIVILRSIDEEQMKSIIQNNLDIDTITESLENGSSTNEVLQNIQEQMTTSDKVSLVLSILFASYIFKYIIIGGLLLTIYTIIVRWIIYKKAGKNGFATIIPIYREITMYKICQLSPWLLLFVFVPIIGAFVLGIVGIISRFRLAKVFGRGTAFGFGLLFLGIIFESILAFSGNIKYTGIETNEE